MLATETSDPGKRVGRGPVAESNSRMGKRQMSVCPSPYPASLRFPLRGAGARGRQNLWLPQGIEPGRNRRVEFRLPGRP